MTVSHRYRKLDCAQFRSIISAHLPALAIGKMCVSTRGYNGKNGQVGRQLILFPTIYSIQEKNSSLYMTKYLL